MMITLDCPQHPGDYRVDCGYFPRILTSSSQLSPQPLDSHSVWPPSLRSLDTSRPTWRMALGSQGSEGWFPDYNMREISENITYKTLVWWYISHGYGVDLHSTMFISCWDAGDWTLHHLEMSSDLCATCKELVESLEANKQSSQLD